MYLQIKMSQKEKFKNGAIITTSLVWLEDPAVWIVSIMSRAKYICNLKTTRTARMPAFWEYPPLPHDYLPILVIHIRSKVKTRQSEGYKIKEFAKISNLWIIIIVVYLTHLLKLLDKIRKYKMDPAGIVEDTEQTQFCLQTDRRTDRWTRWNQYTPFNFVERRVKWHNTYLAVTQFIYMLNFIYIYIWIVELLHI